MTLNFDYSIPLSDVPNYGKVKVLFGLKEKEYSHYDGKTFVVTVEEVKSRKEYSSLKKILSDKNYI